MLPPGEDFPDRYGPMLVKELRQGLRSRGFGLALIALPAVLSLTIIFSLAAPNPAEGRGAVEGFFWGLLFLALLVLFPLRALAAIRTERQAKTLELLRLTPLSAGRIVWHKWAGLGGEALLVALAFLPYIALRYFYGEVDLASDAFTLLWTVLLSGALIAVGLALSTLPRWWGWILALGVASSTAWVPVFLRAGGVRRAFPGADALWVDLYLVYVLLGVTALALVWAAGRIAPLADDYPRRLRLLALGIAVGGHGLGACGAPDEMQAIWGVGSVVMLLSIAALELLEGRRPLRRQIQTWSRWGPAGRALNALHLRGWPSAGPWAATVAVVGGLLLLPHQPSTPGAWVFLGWIPCALAAVLFPAVLLSLIARPRAGRVLSHFLVYLVGSIASSMLATFFGIATDGQGSEAVLIVAHLPPVSPAYFLAVAAESPDRLPSIVIAASVWCVGSLVVLGLRGAGYWATVAAIGRGEGTAWPAWVQTGDSDA